MARWTFAAIVALLVNVIVLVAAPADASGIRNHATLVSGMAGYTDHQSEQSGERVGGGSWSFDFSRMGRDSDWSAGFVLRRFESDENFQTEVSGQNLQVNAKRLLAAVQGTYYIVDGRFSPYLNAMAGVHMQTSDVYRDGEEEARESSQTFAAGFSAGTYLHVTDGIFLRAEYTFHYFSKSDTLKNNAINGFYAGLGFQFGGY